MRRIASSGLIGFGAFLIVAAALIRFYAYPTLATVPTNYESTTMLEAQGATIFNADTLQVDEGVGLTITSYTIADSSIEAPDGVAVWKNRTSIVRDDVADAACPQTAAAAEDVSAGCFQQSTEQGGFDAVSGVGVSNADCATCLSSVSTSGTVSGDDETEAVDRSGQWLKFPFDTQKKDYLQWDSTTGTATPAVYEGTEKIDGLTVYKFVQTIPETTLAGTRSLPGSIFGVSDATVEGSTVYSMERTMYIEPVTGAPVDRVEKRTQEFEYDGVRVPAFNGTVAYTDDQVAESVDAAGAKAFQLGGMKLLFPLVALLLGLVAIAAGLLLGRERSQDTDTPAKRRELATV